MLLELIKPQSYVNRNGWVHSLICWDHSVEHQKSFKPKIQSPQQAAACQELRGLGGTRAAPAEAAGKLPVAAVGTGHNTPAVVETDEKKDSPFSGTQCLHITATISVSAECEPRVFHATECGDFFLLLNMLFLETFLIVVMGLFPMGQHIQLRPLYK